MVATAKAQRWEPVEVLKVLLAEEVAGRDRSALATRWTAAGFPTGKTFLLEPLGQQAVEQGLKIAWFTLEDFGVLLRRDRADDTVTKAIADVCRPRPPPGSSRDRQRAGFKTGNGQRPMSVDSQHRGSPCAPRLACEAGVGLS